MEYKEISILYAASKCGISFDYNEYKVEHGANCPFCNDKKKHLGINVVKNQFRCNRCGESGNSITLYAKVFNIDTKTAYKELSAGTNQQVLVFDRKPIAQAEQFKVRSLLDRHAVYYDMLQMLELSDRHNQQLLNRGLDGVMTEKNMYRTVPEPNRKLYSFVMYNLSKEHNLEGIPGFYLKNGKWHMAAKNGMFIPICNHEGYIQGLQIRLDDVSERKYRWFSSNYYEGGMKATPWIHVTNWNNDKAVYLTEGALKSEVASFLMGGVCFIGLAGVNCHSGLTELLCELGINEIIDVLDMDKFTNRHVTDALTVLKNKAELAGIKFRSAKWNPLYKGIDDFYLAVSRKVAAA